MSKMSTDRVRIALNGPTMGTRWTALFYASPGFDTSPVQGALQAAVDEVDAQMSTWNPASDLMRLNAGPVGEWLAVPARLMEVLCLGLEVGRASGGAFDIGTGDAVTAWGFGPEPATPDRIRTAISVQRAPAHEVLDVDLTTRHLRKRRPITLDLNGIAKGYGTDRLAETLSDFSIDSGLVGLDGEMRALGLRLDGEAWTIAVEAPDPDRRVVHSVLSLQDAAVATSGDYRHWVEVRDRRLSHTINPQKGAPLVASPASVTVIARRCAEADAWATALMVKGSLQGAILARKNNISALFIDREGDQLRETKVGRVFETRPYPEREG